MISANYTNNQLVIEITSVITHIIITQTRTIETETAIAIKRTIEITL
mgnify:CR=1 FL=1|jgi:hypothetical protein